MAAIAIASPPMPQPRSTTRDRPGRSEAPGVQGGDREPGGLFESGFGEEHPVGEGTELGRRLRTEPRLREHGGDEARRMTGFAQVADHAHDVADRVVGRQRIEQPEPFGRQQFDEFGPLHEPSVRTSAVLALTLRDC